MENIDACTLSEFVLKQYSSLQHIVHKVFHSTRIVQYSHRGLNHHAMQSCKPVSQERLPHNKLLRH